MDNKPVPNELMGLDGNKPSMYVDQDQLELSASFWSLYLESGETAIVIWVIFHQLAGEFLKRHHLTHRSYWKWLHEHVFKPLLTKFICGSIDGQMRLSMR